MESNKIIPKGILFPFILLTTLFFAWAVPNNLQILCLQLSSAS